MWIWWHLQGEMMWKWPRLNLLDKECAYDIETLKHKRDQDRQIDWQKGKHTYRAISGISI